MTTFRMSRLSDAESRIGELVEAMGRFELQPSYQRQSDVWSEEKRALFIDSLVNGYDVPKLYFHRLSGRKQGGHIHAIVDGKQRLETIRYFLDDKFPLSQDFVDSETGEESAAGLRFSELTRKHPQIAGRLMDRRLDVVVIETGDIEVIEEMFSRLNEAVPLNAPEKRNAFGGPMPTIIRRLVARHIFFTDRLPMENTRYRQYDLVTKFLYLTSKGKVGAVKKRDLDDFVKSYLKGSRPAAERAAEDVARQTEVVLTDMASVFEPQDSLLGSVGLVTVYFISFLVSQKRPTLRQQLTRPKLMEFDQLRRHNRLMLRQQQSAIAAGRPAPHASEIRTDLAIFDRLMQSPNDGTALEYRFRILEAFLSNKVFGGLPGELKSRFQIEGD